MVQVFQYTRANKLDLLHDQLLAAGVAAERVEGLGTQLWITVADEQAKSAVDAIVAAHDPAVPTTGEIEQQQAAADRADLAAQFQAVMARLDAIVADGGTYTANQVRDAVVDLARSQRRVLRLLRSAKV